MSVESRPLPPEKGGEDLAQTNPEAPPRSGDFKTPEVQPTPSDVAAATRRAEVQEREEAQGEMTEEREDELNARLTIFAIKHPEFNIEDPLEFIRQNPKTAELKIKGLEFEASRDAFNEMYKRWYEASDEVRDQMRAEHEKKSKEYYEARTEYVGEGATHLLRERIRAADKAAEERVEKRGWMGKVYDTWKTLGDLNLDRALSGTRFAPTSKFGKFAARFASVRTAISASLLGAGIGLGAGSAVGIGAIALRRVFAGLGSGFGSYDLLRNATNRWAEKWGWRKEVSAEEAQTMPKEEILERLEHIEAWARLNGKKVSEIPAYQTLLDQYHKGWLELDMMAELEQWKSLEGFLESELGAAQLYIDNKMFHLRLNDAVMKVIGTGVGVLVGSGWVAQATKLFFGHGVGEVSAGDRDAVRDALMGKAEALPKLFDSQIVAHGSPGESATLNPDGTMHYAPPAEGAPPGAEALEAQASFPEEIIVRAAGRGTNTWKMIAFSMNEWFGDRFGKLDSARQSWIIDRIKDEIEKNLKAFGIKDINLIRVGDKLNLTKILGDRVQVEQLFKEAGELSGEQVQSILEHQKTVREFLREHPGYKLRPGDIDRIIRGELTDANYEASLRAGAPPELQVLERPPVQPAVPPVAEAPTAARLNLRFAPGYSAAEQEVIAKQIDYFHDKANALREKLAILEKIHGDTPRFSEFQTDLDNKIARLEDQANGLVKYAERVEDVTALKQAVKTISQEYYTPYADATVQARATGAKFGIVPDEVAGYDIFVDAKEATRDVIRNQNFLAAGAEVPKGYLAEGLLRDAGGHEVARFEYGPGGQPQTVHWVGNPDMKAAKSLLVETWDKTPSSLEKSKILNNAINLERYNQALKELSQAGELRSPEANLLRDALAMAKKKLGVALRPEFRK